MKLAEKLICISIMLFLIGEISILTTINIQEQSKQNYIETQLVPEPTGHRLVYMLMQINDSSQEMLCKKDLKKK